VYGTVKSRLSFSSTEGREKHYFYVDPLFENLLEMIFKSDFTSVFFIFYFRFYLIFLNFLEKF